MDEKELMIKKTLIEIYDREIQMVGRLHYRLNPWCKKCKSLFSQRKKLIKDIKDALPQDGGKHD